jgi:hypothetical protein
MPDHTIIKEWNMGRDAVGNGSEKEFDVYAHGVWGIGYTIWAESAEKALERIFEEKEWFIGDATSEFLGVEVCDDRSGEFLLSWVRAETGKDLSTLHNPKKE